MCRRLLGLGVPSKIALLHLGTDEVDVDDGEIQNFAQALTPLESITVIQWAGFAKPNASRWAACPGHGTHHEHDTLKDCTDTHALLAFLRHCSPAVQSALWVFRETREESYLLLGTSTGHVQVHSSDGQLLHRQRLHTRAVTAIAVRCVGMQAGGDDSSEDITICFEDAVARFSSPEVGPLCLTHSATGRSHSGSGCCCPKATQ